MSQIWDALKGEEPVDHTQSPHNLKENFRTESALARKPGSRQGSENKHQAKGFLHHMNASPRNPTRNTGADHEVVGKGQFESIKGALLT